MRLVYSRCAGLDVHKDTVWVCVRSGRGKSQIESRCEIFGTFTEDLERLRQFLRDSKVRRVVMESTGVFWVPVWNILEQSAWKLDLVLVNPQHVRAIPGRKSDQRDCERLAELGQYDLVRGSLIPPPETRRLRDLTRRRVQLQGDRNRAINRIRRLLETVNLKLGSVVSDIAGKTGWLILKAIEAGETDPEFLCGLAQGRLRDKKVELKTALRGCVTEHFRWLLGQLMGDLEYLDRRLTEVVKEIRIQMAPHAELIRRLTTIPGVQETTAWTIVAELGTDMSRFPTAHHAASWAGLCPGQKESAGKRQSGRTRKGNRYLRRILIQNGWAVSHSKECFLTALFYRVASRRGLKRAAMAVAHRVLLIAYCIIRDGSVYREIGGDYYDRVHPERTAMRLTRRLERIGYSVTLTKPQDGQTVGPQTPSGGRPLGTGRWVSPFKHKPVQKEPTAHPDLCPKCAKWGIACIHAKNRGTQVALQSTLAESEA